MRILDAEGRERGRDWLRVKYGPVTPVRVAGEAAPAHCDHLLLETGDSLFQEDGSSVLCLIKAGNLGLAAKGRLHDR